MPERFENPSIYHLDVGAMYPNIILTNRLQPTAIVDSKSNCMCKRNLEWEWRGDVFPTSGSEYKMLRRQIAEEVFAIENTLT